MQMVVYKESFWFLEGDEKNNTKKVKYHPTDLTCNPVVSNHCPACYKPTARGVKLLECKGNILFFF